MATDAVGVYSANHAVGAGGTGTAAVDAALVSIAYPIATRSWLTGPDAAHLGLTISSRTATVPRLAESAALTTTVAIALRAVLDVVIAARGLAHAVQASLRQAVPRYLASLLLGARRAASTAVDGRLHTADGPVAADPSQERSRLLIVAVVGERTCTKATRDERGERQSVRQAARLNVTSCARNRARRRSVLPPFAANLPPT
jgi:hypothetical protein